MLSTYSFSFSRQSTRLKCVGRAYCLRACNIFISQVVANVLDDNRLMHEGRKALQTTVLRICCVTYTAWLLTCTNGSAYFYHVTYEVADLPSAFSRKYIAASPVVTVSNEKVAPKMYKQSADCAVFDSAFYYCFISAFSRS